MQCSICGAEFTYSSRYPWAVPFQAITVLFLCQRCLLTMDRLRRKQREREFANAERETV